MSAFALLLLPMLAAANGRARVAPLPAPQWGLSAAPEKGDPWEAMYARVAEFHGVDVETLKRAAASIERESGAAFRTYARPKEIEKQLTRDDFRRQHLAAARYTKSRPAQQDRAGVVIRLAREFRLSPAEVEGAVRRHRIRDVAETPAEFERALHEALQKDEMTRVLRDLPENPQKELVAALLSEIRARSGESVEETARAGAFAYVRFSGDSVIRASAGRDPDRRLPSEAVFYVTFTHGRFSIALYRNLAPGASALGAFRRWLQLGLPTLRLD